MHVLSVKWLLSKYMWCNIRKHTFGHVGPSKIQIRMRILGLVRIFTWSILDSHGCNRGTALEHSVIKLCVCSGGWGGGERLNCICHLWNVKIQICSFFIYVFGWLFRMTFVIYRMYLQILGYLLSLSYFSLSSNKSILAPAGACKLLLDEWQTVRTLIRCRILRRLIWFNIVH